MLAFGFMEDFIKKGKLQKVVSEFKWNPEAGLRFIVPLSDPRLPPVTRGEGISSGTNSQVQLVVLSTPQ